MSNACDPSAGGATYERKLGLMRVRESLCVRTDNEVELLLEVTLQYEVSKIWEGAIWWTWQWCHTSVHSCIQIQMVANRTWKSWFQTNKIEKPTMRKYCVWHCRFACVTCETRLHQKVVFVFLNILKKENIQISILPLSWSPNEVNTENHH